jgi:hypothetical protein
VLLAVDFSGESVDTLAVLMQLAPAETLATIVNAPVSSGPMLGREHDTVPFAPAAGVVQVHPVGALSDTNVAPAGSGSVNTTFAAQK